MEQYLNEFIIFATATFIALLSPGPDFAITLKHSIKYGKRSAIMSSLGISAGIAVHVFYTIIGIGLIISKSVIAFNIIKYLGAAYLIYLGYQGLRSRGMSLKSEDFSHNESIDDKSSFIVGFFCNLLNPKATLFFLSVFTVIVDINTPIYMQVIYGVFCIFANFFWYSGLAFLLTRKKIIEFLKSFGHIFDKVVGTVLISLGLKVAFSK